MSPLIKLANRWRELRAHPAYCRHSRLVLWRAALWTAHCLLRLPAKTHFARWDFWLSLPPQWQGAGATTPFLFREYYEPELVALEKLLRPGMVFVDGGANTGVFTFLAARLVGNEGRVIAFEPGLRCFRSLERSAQMNQFPQVVLRRCALSDRRGACRLYHHNGQDNSFGLGQPNRQDVPYEEVETMPLDEALLEAGCSQVDFVKLDVEGAQELVLRGARRLLDQCRPAVLLEVDGAACRRMGVAPEGACGFLTELKYHFFTVNEQGHIRSAANPTRERRLLAVCNQGHWGEIIP